MCVASHTATVLKPVFILPANKYLGEGNVASNVVYNL